MTIEEALDKLKTSKFRGRFKLTAADLAYIERVGIEAIERHAADFVRDKLSAAEPANDGKQTPMRGHPVFKAMQATATCCRGCMEKWWKVRRGKELTEAQQTKAVNLIIEWISRQNVAARGDARRPLATSLREAAFLPGHTSRCR